MKQEPQLSQRDRAMLRVIEYCVKSLKIIGNDTLEKGVKSLLVFRCNYLVPVLGYSASNRPNGVTLKSSFGVVQGH